jgi:enamine deaminase RidA (YjgF/YER057c/UK114 family)
VLFCAGQTSVDGNGNPLHAGNMEKQLSQALSNLETVLKQAGMTFANVVRLNYYVTDVQAFLKASAQAGARLGGAKPPGTLLGVAALFHPDIVIEIEATAVA